jgi:glycosyltransferase involved in cell wall biosynthesis
MKVALIVDEFSVEKGTGIARYSYEIYKGLKERGIEVEPIVIKPPNIPFGEAINHVFLVPYHLLKKANNFDIIHATSPITGLCFPFIKKPKVMTYHDIITLIYKGSGNSLHARLAAPLFFRIGDYSDRIITVSSQTKEEIVDYLKIPKEKINVVNNGVDNEFTQLSKEKQETFTIGYLGAFTLRKKIDYLIRAFYFLKTEHPEIKVKLKICGKKTGEYENLIKLVKELCLEDDVEFRGFIPQNDLVETYNSFDIFALTSEWEGFCIPIIEAQSCGVPVIIRGDAHIPDEISTCCLKVNSEKDMAKKFYKLVTDYNLRDNIKNQGLEYSKKFAWRKTVDQTLQIYEDVLFENKSSIYTSHFDLKGKDYVRE